MSHICWCFGLYKRADEVVERLHRQIEHINSRLQGDENRMVCLAFVTSMQLFAPPVQKFQGKLRVPCLIGKVVTYPAIRINVAYVFSQLPRQKDRPNRKIFIVRTSELFTQLFRDRAGHPRRQKLIRHATQSRCCIQRRLSLRLSYTILPDSANYC